MMPLGGGGPNHSSGNLLSGKKNYPFSIDTEPRRGIARCVGVGAQPRQPRQPRQGVHKENGDVAHGEPRVGGHGKRCYDCRLRRIGR